jgi:hypothetical protein
MGAVAYVSVKVPGAGYKKKGKSKQNKEMRSSHKEVSTTLTVPGASACSGCPCSVSLDKGIIFSRDMQAGGYQVDVISVWFVYSL